MHKILENILSEYDIKIEEFNEICEDYTNFEIFKQNEEGELIADISEEQSSSKISSISNSDLLIEIPSEIDFCQKGNLLWAQLLKNNFL